MGTNHLQDIARRRLLSHKLAGPKFTTPVEIVGWMGAMQAQDFPMAQWAIGLRLTESTQGMIEAAINKGEILRTHLLRPTWHFVTAEDAGWLIDLSAAQIIAAQRSRDRDLELTEEVYSRSNSIIENALNMDGYLSREELVARLKDAGIANDQNRASHLLMRAELEKIICSGPVRKGKPTYALFTDRVKANESLTKEEALFRLASRYFTSRCPATYEDFTWWSGLPASVARQAIAEVEGVFHIEVMGGRNYYIPNEHISPKKHKTTWALLPPYDEFLISYTDRGASITNELEDHLKKISDRGIFRPVIIFDGQVVGTWMRKINNENVMIELQPFKQYDRKRIQEIHMEASQYATFIDKKIQMNEG